MDLVNSTVKEKKVLTAALEHSQKKSKLMCKLLRFLFKTSGQTPQIRKLGDRDRKMLL